jgi:hypothetical protein
VQAARHLSDGGHPEASPPNNLLQLTRLASGKLEYDFPAELRENGSTFA